MLWIILAILVVLIIAVIGMYNGLVQSRVKVDNAWSQIDVQLQRRFDLIPNFVETVKGYMAHEKERLEIAENGYRKVKMAHTYKQRVDNILENIM